MPSARITRSRTEGDKIVAAVLPEDETIASPIREAEEASKPIETKDEKIARALVLIDEGLSIRGAHRDLGLSHRVIQSLVS